MHRALRVDEKLSVKIPLYVMLASLALKKAKGGSCVCTINISLTKNQSFVTLLLSELCNISRATRFLTSKLIARCQHKLQAISDEALQLAQCSKIFCGIPTVACSIDNIDWFALEDFEIDFVAVDIRLYNVIETLRHVLRKSLAGTGIGTAFKHVAGVLLALTLLRPSLTIDVGVTACYFVVAHENEKACEESCNRR